MELGGKKALVFGGTSGIGLSASELLRDSGVEVVAISRDPSKAGDIELGWSNAMSGTLNLSRIFLRKRLPSIS